MTELKTVIQKILSNSFTIDWLIIHNIAKSDIKTKDIEFSFVDGEERPDEPFKTNQGYISLNNSDTVNEFEKIIIELIKEYQLNTNTLSNIFIIVTRASYSNEDMNTLIECFKKNIGELNCQIVFNTLINSLNNEYHKHSYFRNNNPINTNEWLDLFRSSQYSHGFSDPLLYVLQLIRNEKNKNLNFENIENMMPILRAVLKGWYGFNLNISKEKLGQLFENKNELTFLSAYLIDDSSPDKIAPDWLSQELIDIFIKKYWDSIGKFMFFHVYGLSYRNKNGNKLYKSLEDIIHETLWKQLESNHSETTAWISTLLFPDDIIALFNWFIVKKIELNKITTANREAILNQFIRELQRISKNLPNYLASENSSDPFNSFQLYETKYQYTFVILFLFFLNAMEKNQKELKDICYEFKLLFYGGYKSKSLATHFTELILLIALSGNRITGSLDESEIKNFQKFLKIIEETILVPYIHISEREEDIWNYESEKQVMTYSAGKYLVNNSLKEIKNHEIFQHYKGFFKSIDSIKIAQWPFERV